MAYICGALSNVTHSLYLLMVQKVTEKDLGTVETLQLNSFNTLPFLTAYMILNGEVFEVMEYEQFTKLSFIILFSLTVSMGCLLNYSLFLCTSLNSALTTSVVGGVKALLQTIFGMFTFGGISHNLMTYVGLSTNMSGSILYLLAKYQDRQTKAKSGITGMHKVISVSTAEDFQDMEKGKTKTNGFPPQKQLHTIPEQENGAKNRTV